RVWFKMYRTCCRSLSRFPLYAFRSSRVSVRAVISSSAVGDRLDFPEYFPSANPPELRQKMSRSAVRRKKRELANKRAEFRDLNIERADRAVVSALALKPQSVA
ncbi:unnamed protein product, partial [Prorocentrum cordatum]